MNPHSTPAGAAASDPLTSALLLAFALFLVLLNGFFVAAEFALVKVRSSRIEELVEKNTYGAKQAQNALKHLDAYLSATQLGITLASLGLGYIGEPAFANLLEPVLGRLDGGARHFVAGAIAFTIITALHIIYGELIPKSLAIARSEPVTLKVVVPLHAFYWLFQLPIRLLNATAALNMRPFGVEPAGEGDEEAHSEEELRIILNASHEGGKIEESEYTMVRQVFDMAHRQARSVMIPRPDVVFLSTAHTILENIASADRAGYTRYPLADDDSPDNLVGMIHIKDLLALGRQPASDLPDAERLHKIVRPVLRVPETKAVDEILREFQKSRQRMAVVVDEYGGTAGILTLEDIVEEIVGDLQDEFDRSAPELEPDGRDCYQVDARMDLDKLTRALLFDAPKETENVETVGGWVLARREGKAHVGDEVAFGDATFTVVEMAGRRVRKVRVCVPEPVLPDSKEES